MSSVNIAPPPPPSVPFIDPLTGGVSVLWVQWFTSVANLLNGVKPLTGLPTIGVGTYAAGVVAQAGYITVQDAGGTSRRVLVG